MQCKNHPDLAAAAHCAGCAESYCENCIVELAGQHYCASCKILAIGDRQLIAEKGTIASKEAASSLTLAIIGILLCSVFISIWGIGLSIAAIVTAVKARGQIAVNPQLTGSGKATAALIVGSAALANVVINLIGLANR